MDGVVEVKALDSMGVSSALSGMFFRTIAADILRIVDGVLVEHWDVLQDEASQAESKSGRPMFGDSFTD